MIGGWEPSRKRLLEPPSLSVRQCLSRIVELIAEGRVVARDGQNECQAQQKSRTSNQAQADPPHFLPTFHHDEPYLS